MVMSYKVADVFKRRLSSFGSAALNYWLSPKASRIVFMSTLLAYYQKESNKNMDEVLAAANKQLNIVDNPRAMKSPATFANYLWKDICDRESMDFDIQAKRILSNTPKWMRYGDDRVMRKDLRKIWDYIKRPEKAEIA